MPKKSTYSQEVVQSNGRYLDILNSKKRIVSAHIKLAETSSHQCTLQELAHVHRVDDGVEMVIDARGHWRNIPDYSFRIFDKSFMPAAIGRLDIIGSPHDNLNMGFRLNEMRVETPHFHKFHASGYECAYKTDALNRNEENVKCDRSAGLKCFLDEENIEYGNEPELSTDGLIQPECVEEDPLKGVTFL